MTENDEIRCKKVVRRRVNEYDSMYNDSIEILLFNSTATKTCEFST